MKRPVNYAAIRAWLGQSPSVARAEHRRVLAAAKAAVAGRFTKKQALAALGAL